MLTQANKYHIYIYRRWHCSNYYYNRLNITRYAAQVNRHKLNEIIDSLQKSNEDLSTLFTITEVLTQHIRYQQMYIYMHTILTYLETFSLR